MHNDFNPPPNCLEKESWYLDKEFAPRYDLLESSLLDMHVAQEQHYVGGIFAMEEFFAKVFLALWCLFCYKKV